jgi:hypothetical protein
MMTMDALERAFSVHLAEMEKCERHGCYWALFHLAVVIPDICGALEAPRAEVSDRYVTWCREHFAPGTLTPGDRFQIRNAVLHHGSTILTNRTNVPERRTDRDSFSLVAPEATEVDVHLLVEGKNVAVNVKALGDQTRAALRHWFGELQADSARNAAVEENDRLARVGPKVSRVVGFEGVPVTVTYNTTSSTGKLP